MKRRTLLKIMLGTAPGVAVFGLQRAMWPPDQTQRPQNDPVSIYIDDSGHLYDPGHDRARPTRRVFYGIAVMTRRGYRQGQTLSTPDLLSLLNEHILAGRMAVIWRPSPLIHLITSSNV